MTTHSFNFDIETPDVVITPIEAWADCGQSRSTVAKHDKGWMVDDDEMLVFPDYAIACQQAAEIAENDEMKRLRTMYVNNAFR